MTIEEIEILKRIEANLGLLVARVDALASTQAHAAVTQAHSRPAASSGGAPTVFPNYGRSAGMPIAGASDGDLEFYANGARRSLADPGKSRFHAKEAALLEAIEAERAKQRGEVPDTAEDGPPPF